MRRDRIAALGCLLLQSFILASWATADSITISRSPQGIAAESRSFEVSRADIIEKIERVLVTGHGQASRAPMVAKITDLSAVLTKRARAGASSAEIANFIAESRYRALKSRAKGRSIERISLSELSIAQLINSFSIELAAGINASDAIDSINSDSALSALGIKATLPAIVATQSSSEDQLAVTEQSYSACGTANGMQNHQWALHNYGQAVGNSCTVGVPGQDIGIAGAWELMGGPSQGSRDVVVAVIDTGFNFDDHEDLRSMAWINQAQIPESLFSTIDTNQDGYVDNQELLNQWGTYDTAVKQIAENYGGDPDGNGYNADIIGFDTVGSTSTPNCNPTYDDCNTPDNRPFPDPTGHGTHVAGLIAAKTDNSKGIAGIADGVKIMAIKSFWATSSTNATSNAYAIADGILYAIINGADILNLSSGGTGAWNEGSRAVLELAWQSGMLIVAGAGNNGVDVPFYPAYYGQGQGNCDCEVLAVGGTQSDGAKSVFSNFGQWVDIAAPASNVARIGKYGTVSFGNGTSIAAPIVTGVAALVKSKYPCLSNQQLIDLLTGSAAPFRPNQTFPLGTGLLNATNALTFAQGSCMPVVTAGDLNADGAVNAADLAILLGSWGVCTDSCPGDLNGDSLVDSADLGILLGYWSEN